MAVPDVGARSRTRRGEARYDALVRAAFELIARNGLAGMRLRPVAAAAGVDHSTLHHYFPTRQHLIEAVVEHATPRLRAVLPAGGQTGAEGLLEHLERLGLLMREQPELFVVLREVDMLASRDPVVAELMARSDRGWHEGLRRLLCDLPGASGGEADASVLADVVIATTKGASLHPGQALETLRRLAMSIAPPVQEPTPPGPP